MPTVDDYASLAPFSLEELVGAANAVLRDRPSLHVQGRTVRYYIANGLLPPPSGGPKFARYGVEHLRRIVAIRQWLDEGLSLQEAHARLGMGAEGRPIKPRAPRVRAAVSEGMVEEGRVVRRIPLGDGCVLEVEAGGDLTARLERALRALRERLEIGAFDTTSQ
ncbi:MAG: MerR family transcriptional regulator [Fimbriimonadaceae bacterium]|nr:MerR family transcriptional regulator [Fimbriimonadaceae bacterium]